MELKEKVAYLKGLMEGMEYDVSTKEGKLMAAVVETLDAMAARVEEIDTDVDQLFDEVDAVSEDLEDVEDYYTFYVLILGISENLFWHADISFLKSVSENRSAYDRYITYQEEKKSR